MSQQVVGWGFLMVALIVCGGCDGDCSEEEDAVKEFVATADRSCQTDEDCAVLDLGCVVIPEEHCAGVSVNRSVAESRRWKEIRQTLDDCEDSCEVCGAYLIPHCEDSVCR